MAPLSKTLALAGAFFAMTGFAAPLNKRVVVWETVTDVVWETVDVTTTIYPGQHAQTTVVPVAAAATTTSAAAAVVTSAAQAPVQSQAPAPPASKQETSAAPTTTTTTTTQQAVPTTSSVEQAPAATTAAPVVQAPAAPAAPAVESSSSSSSSAAPAATGSTGSSGQSSSKAAANSGYNGACSSGSPCIGDITYYDTATTMTNPSSCGTTNDGLTELVLALPHGIMSDSDCGKSVTVEYNGVTKTGTVVDKCMGCDNTSIDLSRAFFEAVAGSLNAGRVSGVKWYIN
ncbi:Allergen Asp f 7 [Penicillium diatomitis]|uniref:Allergen Asp f 7 n=1 Tax=Penicillium diatomitis TaxID=2819901 RepID=A0A9X0BTQ1_9EURO|nr:Allergen Asp f 7 [Penicillium diatomitis]KAJ5483878.1 Allergen Asp f 7 [Penicillium diatomitis]